VPLLERALAKESKLGFIGKNTLLIRPKVGSFTFLAELLWDVEIVNDEDVVNDNDFHGCGECNRCIPACPTGALVGPYMLDARKCISYLTIEKKTPFEPWRVMLLGIGFLDVIYVKRFAPLNNSGISNSNFKEFSSSSGPGPYLDIKMLLGIRTNKEFAKRFSGTALMRSGRKALIRNACCVIKNKSMVELIPDLSNLAIKDLSDMVRSQAKVSLKALLEIADGHDKKRILEIIDSRY
jgi:epoxyqueuosine reductase